MGFQPDSNKIKWKIHFSSEREKVFEALATDKGRASFWAESAPEINEQITFHFMDHPPVTGRILKKIHPVLFTVEYFEAVTRFSLESDLAGGTELTLVATGVPQAERTEVISGWVSVLMNMKAVVDYGIDLRNHDRSLSWSKGYADN